MLYNDCEFLKSSFDKSSPPNRKGTSEDVPFLFVHRFWNPRVMSHHVTKYQLDLMKF